MNVNARIVDGGGWPAPVLVAAAAGIVVARLSVTGVAMDTGCVTITPYVEPGM
jgi:hypothetical protein